MPKYSAREAAEKMVDAVSANPGAWAEGVSRTDIDVIARAASEEAEANFKAAMLKVLNEKLRAAGLKAITTEEWKRLCAAKSGSWSSGVSAKRDKVVEKVAAAIAVTYDVAAEVNKLPKGLPGSDQRKQRMIAYFEKRVAAKRSKGT